MKHYSLKSRLYLLILIGIFPALIISSYNSYKTKDIQTKRLYRNGKVLVDNFSLGIMESLVIEDGPEINLRSHNLKLYDEVKEVFVFDREKTQIFPESESGFKGDLASSEPVETQGSIIFSKEVVDSLGQQHGFVSVVLDLNSLHGEIADSFLINMLITFGFILIGGLLSISIVGGIIKPIKQLINVANSIAGGDLQVSIPPHPYKNEIGELTGNITTMRDELHSLVTDMSNKISEKTNQISSMLATIKQGIFTVDKDNYFGEHYSQHLEEIVGAKTLRGKDVMSTFFKNLDLTEDEIRMIDSVIDLSIGGENSWCFDLNKANLPQESRYGDKLLEFSWDPILGADGHITSILVVVRDVTSLRDLEIANKAQAEEMAIIGEILALPAKKFQSSMDNIQSALQNIQSILAQESILDFENLRTLFRSYHTMKGISRGCGFKKLADAIHTAEIPLTQALDSNGEKLPNKTDLSQEFSSVQDIVASYSRTSMEKLGRNAVEKTLPSELMDYGLRLFEDLPPDVRKKHSEFISRFKRTFFTSSTEIFQRIFLEVPSLAAELAIENPEIEIKGVEFFGDPSATRVLEGVFVHLMRNALDHGLESKRIRQKKGKPDRGKLTVMASIEDGFVTTTFADDGAGLRLDKIKKKAVSKGLIGEDVDDANKIAAMILTDGFSTAEHVSQISGRGVGMNAINADVEKAGGSFRVVIDNTKSNEKSVPCYFEIKLPVKMFDAA